ncbi:MULTISPECIES: DUF2140 family protein [Mammaliicoccus]|uniref:DUF2140 family protein n=1 Tax=Mammaliicoccus vitulinus TaxID=71237 RepID=A0ABX7HDW2_9STAP|nr:MULTISPECIES: DUF2140 family protein [Mammaliicoccus]MBO3077087.1 DUF2140 family protein [Mammaliicoccus vitulinus]MEB7656754.1 YpmS family protein [Mammaliicoccus vitulinus]PNZ33964.1 DUF2140 domain-containing protein [Mammaliicoccus vitulinus]PTI88707.1 DUF2140 domain-containing protein [Mammaliicoccus vitulinus]QJF25106.1 DUF2140 family protein [Mammaliicoccus vitulinus]
MENKHWINHKAWFFAFITLIILILLALVYVFISISNDDQYPHSKNEQINKDFTISFNNAELESLMNASIAQYDIQTNITKKALSFDTHTKILGKEIPIKLKTKPVKLNNDTIKFDIQAIDIGKLNISNPFILSQIKKHSDLPPYIHVNPKDESFYLSLDQLDIDNVESIQIQTLDISAKKWYFDIKLK